MKIERVDIAPFTVLHTTEWSKLNEKLVHQGQPILFVVDASGFFLGAITKGDLQASGKSIQAANSEVTHLNAADVCNKNARKLNVNLPDAQISRCFDSRIHCIPLVDDLNRLIALAQPISKKNRVNLNIGAGATVFAGFTNLDVKSEWYAKHQQQANPEQFVEFNIVNDILPYADDSVDNIYLSHVIEHLEDNMVQRFLSDCLRVLKPNAVMRIACPDAEFLAQISAFENDFWFWRRDWFRVYAPHIPPHEITQFDYLVREIATERYWTLRESDFPDDCLSPDNWYTTLEKMVEGLTFREEKIGTHINFWTFDKLKQCAQRAGFENILRSRYQGCVSQDMKGPEFDQTRPEMSLYVDLVG
ncbi:methyltransferase domain-containing protein [Alteromonas sp. a30]|uniref:methyltransferase domain-containing protein n=1 Tax=Alteromonas sp. a30 TaxID=2730917 RepID=UPI002281CE6F|nr:methyltransferase domain-containing protein [Alteromonas sp. a30]MCY7296214.1 methyltransferase domain-containing protein [Alteromonas sp. a30]